jgi:hypothetical protein
MQRKYFALIMVLLISPGCTNINIYKSPLNELSQAVTTTELAIGTVTDEANKAAVNNNALGAAVESKRFGTSELEKTIPSEYIKIRLYGLELIKNLATRLLEVVDSEKGSQAGSAIQDVGPKAKTLAVAVKNTSVAAYSVPVSNLADTVITIYDNAKREAILEKGVRDGVPQAQNIITLLKKDFSPGKATDIQGALKDELSLSLTNKIDAYDNLLTSQASLSARDKKKPELVSARLKAINEIIIANDALTALNSDLVITTLDDLSKALTKLENVVNSNNNPKDLAIFASEVSNFSDSAARLMDAVNSVKHARDAEI